MPDEPKSNPVPTDNPYSRRGWFLRSRRHRDGRLAHAAFARGSAQRKQHEQAPASLREARFFAAAGAAPPPIPPYWICLGPSVVSHGQAKGNPPVSGRVTAIAAGPGGRAYIGTANGGVWFSSNS